MSRMFPAVVFALGLWSCTPAPPPAAPPDTRAADVKTLRDLDAQSLAAWAAKDVDRIAAFYTEDASIGVPNMPLVRGREAMRAGLKGVFADPNFKLEFAPGEVEAALSGDLGFVRGSYTATQTDPKSAKTVVEKGNYLIIYEKQADGSWKVTNDFATPEAPAAEAP